MPDGPQEAIILESKSLLVVIDPQAGGKIRSLFSTRTGTEYLYQDARANFGEGPGYVTHDISGFDECFPTVGPSHYPDGKRKGLFLGDHGLLWQTPWTAEVKDGRVVMAREIPELQIHFERTCVLDGEQSLELAYRITNAADEPLKYVYSAHPILAAGPDTRVMLPDEMDRAYVIFVANVDGVEPQNWIDWPPGVPNLQPPYTATRKSCLKVVSPQLANGVAFVQHQDRGEGLQLEFDAAELPHLGVLIQQGYDADDNGAFQGEVLLALEPTTGIGDDLPTCASTQTLAELGPGQSKSFSIRLTLVGL